MGGRLLIEKKGKGKVRGKGARGTEPSHGEAISFFRRDRRQPAGQTRFDAPRFFHSPRLEASNRNRPRINSLPSIEGSDTSQACGSMHLRLDSPQSEKNRQIGPQSPSATRCQVAHEGNDGSIAHLSNYQLDDANFAALRKCRSSTVRGSGGGV